MTYIPGTGTFKPINPKVEEIKPKFIEEISVVNVSEIKKPKEEVEIYNDDVWYNQLKYWMIFGGIVSAIFAILSVLNFRFLFLTPLPPYIAYLTWHIKKKIRKYVKKLDAFS